MFSWPSEVFGRDERSVAPAAPQKRFLWRRLCAAPSRLDVPFAQRFLFKMRRADSGASASWKSAGCTLPLLAEPHPRRPAISQQCSSLPSCPGTGLGSVPSSSLSLTEPTCTPGSRVPVDTHLPCHALTCGNCTKGSLGAVESPGESFQLLFSSESQSVPVGTRVGTWEVPLCMCLNVPVPRLSGGLMAQPSPWLVPGVVMACHTRVWAAVG